MSTLLAQFQRYKDVEQKLRRLQTYLREECVVPSGQTLSKEELQNLELQFYSLNRDLGGLANDMARTLFSYYYMTTSSNVERGNAGLHQ